MLFTPFLSGRNTERLYSKLGCAKMRRVYSCHDPVLAKVLTITTDVFFVFLGLDEERLVWAKGPRIPSFILIDNYGTASAVPFFSNAGQRAIRGDWNPCRVHCGHWNP